MWYIYIVKCIDGSLYTGVTIDTQRRLLEHNGVLQGGAKSIRGKRPVQLVYTEQVNTRQEALKREKEIKSWRREKKLTLITKSIGSKSRIV